MQNLATSQFVNSLLTISKFVSNLLTISKFVSNLLTISKFVSNLLTISKFVTSLVTILPIFQFCNRLLQNLLIIEFCNSLLQNPWSIKKVESFDVFKVGNGKPLHVRKFRLKVSTEATEESATISSIKMLFGDIMPHAPIKLQKFIIHSHGSLDLCTADL